jgi:hypothetical protein
MKRLPYIHACPDHYHLITGGEFASPPFFSVELGIFLVLVACEGEKDFKKCKKLQRKILEFSEKKGLPLLAQPDDHLAMQSWAKFLDGDLRTSEFQLFEFIRALKCDFVDNEMKKSGKGKEVRLNVLIRPIPLS